MSDTTINLCLWIFVVIGLPLPTVIFCFWLFDKLRTKNKIEELNDLDILKVD